VILGRFLRIVPDGAQEPAAVAGDEEAEREADAERATDFSFPVVLPPRVTVMNAFPTAHPDPNNPDMYPYILGVSSNYILLNFGVGPFYGVCLDDRPVVSNLIVVRHFDPSGVEQHCPPTGHGRAHPASRWRVPHGVQSLGRRDPRHPQRRLPVHHRRARG
jgi:hypothetical protein